METTTKAHALLPGVSKKGKIAQLFDKIYVNLLSVGPLCNKGCTVAFMPTKSHVIKRNKIIMSALRNQNNGMWVYNFDKNNDEMHELCC